MAADAEPLEIILHLPLLCEDKVRLFFVAFHIVYSPSLSYCILNLSLKLGILHSYITF